MRPLGKPEKLEERRFQAIKLLKRGVPPVEVARQLRVDRRSVRRWNAAFRELGKAGIQAQPNSGRPRRLTAKQSQQLQQALIAGAQKAGFPTSLWTCPRVAHFIQEKFGVGYHVDHVGRLLHGMGFSPQKPTRRAVERDEEEIQRWIHETWPAIKKKAHRVKGWLVFLDESGILMAPLVRRSWALRGQTPVLYQRGRHHQKVSVIAALCVSPDRNEVRLYFRLYPDHNIKAQDIVPFLRAVDRELNGRWLLLWDRLNAHRAKHTRRALEEMENLETFFFPSYAPELNPVEHLWAYLKMNPLANLEVTETQALAQITRRSARGIQRKESLLRSFIKQGVLFLRLK